MYVKRKVAEIVVPNRLREIDQGHVERLKRNLRQHGLLEPVVVDSSNTLLCGAHRLQAAKELGWEEIDCHVVEGVTDALLLEMVENALRKQYTSYELYFYIRQRWETASQASSARMGRKKKGETASKRQGKTTEVIGRECGVSGEQVRRIKLIGDTALADEHYAGYLEDLKQKKLNKVWKRFQSRWNADKAVAAISQPQSKLALGKQAEEPTCGLPRGRLYQGDCRELLPTLPDHCVHAVICDLPFGIGMERGDFHDVADNPDNYGEWLKPIVSECRRVVVPGGLLAFFVTSDMRYIERSREWFGDGVRLFIAVKKAARGYIYQTPAVVAYDTVVFTFNDGARPLMPVPTTSRQDWFAMRMQFDPEALLFPHPKCLDICEYLVESFTVEGGIVLDPCMGSGSIPLAASRKSRRYIGIEREQTFYDLARLRMHKYGKPEFDYWGAFGKRSDAEPD